LNPFSARIPDSTIAKEATELLLEVSPAFLANHCLRTFVFGDLLGQAANLNYDLEILYLGSLLHDLGLTERFDGTEPFEIDGANAAYAFLKEHGLPLEKAALVR
jgi:HD superfamily phosphodiesterase